MSSAIARALVVVASILLCGCQGPRVVKTYSGQKLDLSQVARLYDTPNAKVERIDGAKQGADLFGRRSAYDLLPGQHEIVVSAPRDPRRWSSTFDYDCTAGRVYGFRVTQILRNDRTVQSWEPRLVDYLTAQELAAPRPAPR